MKSCNKALTIRNIINSLTDIMATHPSLNLDSEVIISDISYQEFKGMLMYLSKDMYYGEDKLGIQLSPKEVVEPYEREGYLESRLGDIMGVTEEETNEEPVPVPVKRNWWDKYK